MLTEEQIEISESVLRTYLDDMEQWVIQDIAKRLQNNLIYSNTICNELEAMKKLGYSPAKLRREIMKVTKANPRIKKVIAENTAEYRQELAKKMAEVNGKMVAEGKSMVYQAAEIAMAQERKIWNEAGKKLRENSALEQISKAFANRLEDDVINLTKTTGFKNMFGYTELRKAYTDTLNKSILRMASGLTSAEQEVKECIRELSQSGLKSINYESGRTYSLDTAIRTAFRTTYNQLSANIMDSNMKNTEESLVFVSEHWGARNEGNGVANHENWQGKVYKIDDSEHKDEEKRLGYEIKSLLESTGYDAATSTVVDPRGLHGYNCRHQHYVWFEGISEKPKYEPQPEPKVINGKKYDYYAMTQKMRKMEREVRALRKERLALKELGIDTDRQKTLRKQIANKTDDYLEFAEKCGIKPKTNRLRVEKAGVDITRTKAYKDYEKMANEVEADNLSYKVDNSVINTKAYTDKFAKVGKNKDVGMKMRNEALDILKHRDGTPYEDIVFCDYETGERVLLVNDRDTKFGVSLSDEQKASLREYDKPLIAMHNHPGGSRPSFGDMRGMYEIENIKESVVIGHNGKVFSMSNLNRNIDIEKIYKNCYNELDKGDKELTYRKVMDILFKNRKILSMEEY